MRNNKYLYLLLFLIISCNGDDTDEVIMDSGVSDSSSDFPSFSQFESIPSQGYFQYRLDPEIQSITSLDLSSLSEVPAPNPRIFIGNKISGIYDLRDSDNSFVWLKSFNSDSGRTYDVPGEDGEFTLFVGQNKNAIVRLRARQDSEDSTLSVQNLNTDVVEEIAIDFTSFSVVFGMALSEDYFVVLKEVGENEHTLYVYNVRSVEKVGEVTINGVFDIGSPITNFMIENERYYISDRVGNLYDVNLPNVEVNIVSENVFMSPNAVIDDGFLYYFNFFNSFNPRYFWYEINLESGFIEEIEFTTSITEYATQNNWPKFEVFQATYSKVQNVWILYGAPRLDNGDFLTGKFLKMTKDGQITAAIDNPTTSFGIILSLMAE